MAHIKINKEELEEIAGVELSDEFLREEASFLGVHWNHVEDVKWDVEVYPDRPDLLSVEGLARAYRGYLGEKTGPERYEVEEGDLRLEVDDSVEMVRPFIAGAIIRDLELDKRAINGLIQLQEKLHETMGRQRDKLAIGLHDLSELEPPFTYRAVEPGAVSFTPLEHQEEMQLAEILDEHEKGREFAWILEDEARYPVIVDSEDRVLSFPPIINNQLTEVDEGTTDVFIDVTGKHLETVKKALNILATALAERGGEIESVEVDGDKMPDLEPASKELEIEYLRGVSGLDLEPAEVKERLERMKFGAEVSADTIEVEVPAYRTDVMHQYDLVEDVVIAHGYTNIEPELPEVDQVAGEKKISDFTDILREILQGAGGLEAHTYILSSREKLFDRMEIEREDVPVMSNALTEDYSAVRNWLLPSLVETLKMNRHNSYPQRFFEVEDIAELDGSDTGASNRRKVAYVESGSSVDYTHAREILQVIERELGLEFDVKEGEKGCFRDQRSAEVYIEGEKVGIIGELSEEVLDNWELERPTAGFELDAESLLEHYTRGG